MRIETEHRAFCCENAGTTHATLTTDVDGYTLDIDVFAFDATVPEIVNEAAERIRDAVNSYDSLLRFAKKVNGRNYTLKELEEAAAETLERLGR